MSTNTVINCSKRYGTYSYKVQAYMKGIIEELEHDYGSIPQSWLISLDMLADQLNIYYAASEDIIENGVSYINRDNRRCKSPSVTTMNNCVGTINTIIKNFALSPVGRSKIKLLESVDSDAVVDNYVKSLTD